MFRPKELSARAVSTWLVALSAAIWGFGFVSTTRVLTVSGPLWMTVIRFTAACVLTAPLVYALGARRALNRQQLLLSMVPGFLLCSTLLLQTWGLRLTSVTNSGFITTLYVLIVPALERLVLRREVGWRHFAWVIVALGGTALMCGWASGAANLGDLMTLACAVIASVHILVVDRIVARVESPLAFSLFQSFWAALLALPFAVAFEVFPSSGWTRLTVFSLSWLICGSTMIGFMLQIVVQRHLAPRVVSLLYLLESPFAAFFAWLFLGERLTVTQAIGGALILAAAGGSTLTKAPAKKPH